MVIGMITRCKDEYFVEEFCEYYINQGIDIIHIIDDDSDDKSIYDNLLNNPQVRITFEKDIIATNYANKLYHELRGLYDWMICVDADEFITTKINSNKTIRDELESTFKNVDCIKIPWVMMSCNSIEKSPKSILETNVYRWNHDLPHENKASKEHKFRCRYEKIETKCIFNPRVFSDVADHHPLNPVRGIKIVDGVHNCDGELDPFFDNLRENDIANGYLLTYHYRIISIENSKNKIRTNTWYSSYSLQDLMSTDYNEILDQTLRTKSLKSKIRFVHITKTAGTSIEEAGRLGGMQWGRYDNRLKYGRKLFEVNPAYWHVPIRLFEKNPYGKDNILFTVVRNPYERIVSECFCKWGGKYKDKEFSTTEEFNKYIFERVGDCLNYDFFHFTPQYLYTHNEFNQQIVDHILHYENLEEEFRDLMSLYGLDICLDSHENRSNKIYSVADISSENIRLINDKYHNDFIFFNYPKLQE